MLGTAETYRKLSGKYSPEEQLPVFFGPEGSIPQRTQVVDSPLEVTNTDFQNLYDMTSELVKGINSYPLLENSQGLGINKKEIENDLLFDSLTGSSMLYGGLDVYKDSKQGFRILEINSRVQCMGIQDYRQGLVGLYDQPTTFEQIAERFRDEDYKKILILSSTKNAFWRGHKRVSDLFSTLGFNSQFSDAEGVRGLVEDNGFIPDVIVRFPSSTFVLNSLSAAYLRELSLNYKIPYVNSMSSGHIGSRGFLYEIGRRLPQYFPDQVDLKADTQGELLQQYPWIKLETGDFAYVVNYLELRKWGKDALTSLISGDNESFLHCIGDKASGDAQKLREAYSVLIAKDSNEVKWIAQKSISPQSSQLSVDGIAQEIKVLHRVYWVVGKDGKVSISLEGFGCSSAQYSQSKGKINAGTGYAVPIKLV